jgi:hypothetical protein
MSGSKFDRNEMYHNLTDPTPKMVQGLVGLTKEVQELKEVTDNLDVDGLATKEEIDNLAKAVDTKEINAMYPPAPYQGLVGNSDAGDNAKLQTLLDNFPNVVVPIGDYAISQTLKMKPNSKLRLEGGRTRYNEGVDKVARLKVTANVPLIEMNDGCSIIGGKLEVLFKGYSSSVVLVDYSTQLRKDIIIDTVIRGYHDAGSRGVLLTGNGDGGTCENVEIYGSIINMDIGIKTEKLGGTCWATAMIVDSNLISCNQAIVVMNGAGAGGGRFSGSYQPRLGTKGTKALVEFHDVNSFRFDAMIWDLSTAINPYGLALYNCTQPDISSRINPDLILNKSRRPTNVRNPVIPPRGRTTYFDSMAGNEENILFGAHEKHTVTFTNSANVGITTDNGTYEKFGMFKLQQKPTYMNLSASSPNAEEWVSITIDFDSLKYVTMLGFNPVSDPTPRPKSYRLYTKSSTDANFVLRKEANTGDEIAASGGYPETALFTKVDPFYGKNTVSLKFEFLLERDKYAIIDSLWAKGSGSAEAYIPNYGGKMYGSLEMKKGNVTLTPTTASGVANNTPFIDSADNKFKFKNNAGNVIDYEGSITALNSRFQYKEDYGTEPPTTGKWNVMDRRNNTDLFPGGYIGWVCTQSGEFGTATEPVFNPFGLISE